MNNSYTTLPDAALALGEGAGAFGTDRQYDTVRDFVDELVDLGNTPKVYARHDSHLGLERDLSEDFLNAQIEELDQEAFEEEIKLVLGEVNTIIPLSRRSLTEDDIEEIKEDMAYRGADPDDF